MAQTFWQIYKKTIINTIIGVACAGFIPTVIWVHNSYADDRYMQQDDSIKYQIEQVDNALFEIDQEISFALDERERAKWLARKEYYIRKKQELERQLDK